MILNFRTSLKFAPIDISQLSLLFLTERGVIPVQTATAQSPAMLKAQHAQGGTQTQSAAIIAGRSKKRD